MTVFPSTGTADPLRHRSVDESFAAVSGARRNARRRAWWVLAVVTSFLLGACQASPQTDDPGTAANKTPASAEQIGPAGAAPSGPIAAVCDNQVPGPAAAPADAVVVDPAVTASVTHGDMMSTRPPPRSHHEEPGLTTAPARSRTRA